MKISKKGFTLIKILVVIAIISLLAAIRFPVFSRAREAARRTSCASNMKQLGIGIRLYIEDYDERLPVTSHTNGSNLDRTWIYIVKPYVGNSAQIRLCPSDPKNDERLAEDGTSYVLNDLVFDAVEDPVTWRLQWRHINEFPRPSETFTVFEISDSKGTSVTEDHIHGGNWFKNPGASTWNRILADIQPDRHSPSANYLYLDGHVKAIPAVVIKGYADRFVVSGSQTENFVKPPQ